MLEVLNSIKLTLDALDPRLWWLGIALLTYLVMWCWRWLSKWLPVSLQFDQCPARVKALPAAGIGLLLGAASAGLSSVELGQQLAGIVVDAIAGACSGVTSVGLHEMVNRLLGAGGTLAPKPPPA